MTIDTVELRKIQYAQELAAYTMRQWMLMRDSPDPKHGSESTSGPTSAAQTTAPSSGHQTRGDISRCPSAGLHLAGRLTVCFATSCAACPCPYQVLALLPGRVKWSIDNIMLHGSSFAVSQTNVLACISVPVLLSLHAHLYFERGVIVTPPPLLAHSPCWL